METEKLLSNLFFDRINNRKNRVRLTKKEYLKWIHGEYETAKIVCSDISRFMHIRKTENGICYCSIIDGEMVESNVSYHKFWEETRSFRNKLFLVPNTP